MTDLFEVPDDATPLTPEEQQDLKPAHISFRSELNLAEQENIARAKAWALRTNPANLLSEKFVRDLHHRMFNDVWRWAGRFRKTERNIGIEAWKIPVELKTLLDDAQSWIRHRSYSLDEIAVRFHHRLVWIHPFPNGNGRHARLIADLLITQLGGPPFTWGSGSLHEINALRSAYVAALRAADGHDIVPLLAFARS
jgi:Fic-DOC domain mobile mystery protein B